MGRHAPSRLPPKQAKSQCGETRFAGHMVGRELPERSNHASAVTTALLNVFTSAEYQSPRTLPTCACDNLPLTMDGDSCGANERKTLRADDVDYPGVYGVRFRGSDRQDGDMLRPFGCACCTAGEGHSLIFGCLTLDPAI